MEKGKEKKADIRNGVEYCIHNMPKETCVWCTKEDRVIKKKKVGKR